MRCVQVSRVNSIPNRAVMLPLNKIEMSQSGSICKFYLYPLFRAQNRSTKAPILINLCTGSESGY